MATLHLAQEILNIIYPVGSIYMSWNSTDPSKLFGGTWLRLKQGFVYCANTSCEQGNGTGTSTNNHKLTIAEMPNHSHAQYVTANPGTGGPGIRRDWDEDASGLSRYPQGSNTGDCGGNQGHGHAIPYISIFTWRRTA